MSFASDRQQASFDHAQRVHERILRAGPPEPELFTVTFRTTVFAEGPYKDYAQVEAWLRERLNTDATISLFDEDETLIIDIEDTIDGIADEDEAREAIENLISGGDHALVIESCEIDNPTEDEPDWDAIIKDRRIDEEFGD